MRREDEVELQMLKACYQAYKDDRNIPSTIRDLGVEGMTVKEFKDSQRRLMQKGMLSGHVAKTGDGHIYPSNYITKKGIKYAEEITNDALCSDMVAIDIGFNGKWYRFKKWIKDNKKWVVTTGITIIGILVSVLLSI